MTARLPGLPGLAGLAWRRALPPGLCIVFLGLALFAVRREPLGASSSLSLAALGPEAGASAERAFARHAALALLGGLTLAWTAASAARAGALWRRRDAEWLAPRAASPGLAVLGTWTGTMLAASLLLVVSGATAEFAAGAAPPALRPRAELSGPRVVLLPDAREARWELTLPAGPHAVQGTRDAERDWRVLARLTPTFGGGRAADVRFTLEHGDDPNGAQAVSAHIAAPTNLLLPLPAVRAAETLTATLTRTGGAAALVLDRGALTLLETVGSERAATLAVSARLLLAGAALTALALGLASWMRAGLALLLLGAFGLAGLVHAERLGAGVDFGLARAFEQLLAGLAPPGPSAATALTALALVALGLLAARAGRSRWEREP